MYPGPSGALKRRGQPSFNQPAYNTLHCEGDDGRETTTLGGGEKRVRYTQERRAAGGTVRRGKFGVLHRRWEKKERQPPKGTSGDEEDKQGETKERTKCTNQTKVQLTRGEESDRAVFPENIEENEAKNKRGWLGQVSSSVFGTLWR